MIVMNKNRGIWVVIGSILVIGFMVTFATASFIKSKEEISDTVVHSAMSSAQIPESPEEKMAYSESPQVFSANLGSPLETDVAEAKVKSRQAAPVITENPASDTVSGEPEINSMGANEAPAAAFISPDETKGNEPVISPISPETKSKLSNNDSSAGGAAYFQKHLEELDGQIKKMREESGDSNTYSMKALAEKEFKLWIREQNAIYNAILDRLSEDEEAKRALESEQQEWLKSRDAKAEDVAKKYSGGSLEELEYTASQAVSTRARAYDLVAEYRHVLSSGEGQ